MQEEIYVPAAEGFELVPAGVHQGICVGIDNYGFVPTEQTDQETGEKKVKDVHKIALVFQIEPEDEPRRRNDGGRFVIKRRFTNSLHKQSALRPFLESWRNKPFADDELKNRFRLNAVIGANVVLNIQHETRNGKIFANIKSVMPFNKRYGAPLEAEPYTPVTPQTAAVAPAQARAATAAPQAQPAPDDEDPAF